MDRLLDRGEMVGECLEWQGTLHNSGYGIIEVGGKQLRVHRLSFELNNGPIPDGMLVCHTCDNRKCFRPEHLFLGTHTDNAKDRNSKGRQAKAENHGRAKLTDDQVRAIRRDTRRRNLIAADYGVSESNIQKIKARIVWDIPARG